MIAQSITHTRKSLHKLRPIIHCITNPISIELCANGILSVGARPIMAEHPLESLEVTSSASALLMNLGNITDVRMCSMKKSLVCAEMRGIPRVLDAVGVSASSLRRNFANELLSSSHIDVIKGNYSEITSLHDLHYSSDGVDSDPSLSQKAVLSSAVSLAKKYNSVVLASGKCDVICDGETVYLINNGTQKLSLITGTGCLLGALCTAYNAVTDSLTAAISACTVLGICGELADSTKGNGSFGVALLDRLSTLTDEELTDKLNLEVKRIEEI